MEHRGKYRDSRTLSVTSWKSCAEVVAVVESKKVRKWDNETLLGLSQMLRVSYQFVPPFS